MQVKSIEECSKGGHSAILLTIIKLPFVMKIFVLSIFEWPFYTGFTVIPITICLNSSICSFYIKYVSVHSLSVLFSFVSVLWLFLAVLWVSLQRLIVLFPGHTDLLF